MFSATVFLQVLFGTASACTAVAAVSDDSLASGYVFLSPERRTDDRRSQIGCWPI